MRKKFIYKRDLSNAIVDGDLNVGDRIMNERDSNPEYVIKIDVEGEARVTTVRPVGDLLNPRKIVQTPYSPDGTSLDKTDQFKNSRGYEDSKKFISDLVGGHG